MKDEVLKTELETAYKKYTDDEVAKDRERLATLEAIEHHEHTNKDELDKVADGDVAKWNAATEQAHEHANEEELAKIKVACEEAEKIFNDAKDFIKPGMNCQDVYAWFQNEVERKGYGWSWPKSCNPGVFSGYGCPGGHMGAPDFPIQKGDVVNIDFGIIVDGYGCDLQRMYYILKDGETEAPEDLVFAFNAVRDGIQKAAEALKPGVTGLEVDTVARDYIMSLGFPSWNAALGHQMGRVAHDGGPLLGPVRPRYNRDELIRVPLYENMVFTLEPGVPTRAGRVALEEDVVVKKDGAEFIVPPQTEFYLI